MQKQFVFVKNNLDKLGNEMIVLLIEIRKS